jgi:hypothetical protein
LIEQNKAAERKNISKETEEKENRERKTEERGKNR